MVYLMKYVGGKSRLMKHLKPIIESYLKPTALYVEPFLGGGNSFIQIEHPYKLGTDCDDDLINLHRYIRDCKELKLDYITPEIYRQCKNTPHLFSSYKRAYISICGSFQGKKWGGYAGIYSNPDKGVYRDYPREALKDLQKSKPRYQSTDTFLALDYKSLDPEETMLIYCDPPYKGTTGYEAGSFNHDEFWNTAREWSKVCPVLVSEFTYPEDFKPIWTKPRKQSLDLKGDNPKIESLVVMIGGKADCKEM